MTTSSSAQSQPISTLHGVVGEPAPSGLTWRRIPGLTSAAVDSFTARAQRIRTDLTGFCRAERLDGAELEILNAMADLRTLRVHVRQLRAEAKADQRRAA